MKPGPLLLGAVSAGALAVTTAGWTSGPGPAPLPSPPPLPATIESPVRIAQDKWGDLVVSDHAAQKILILDGATLGLQSSFDVEGRPLGVATDGSTIFVGNQTTRRVEAYDRSGAHLYDVPGDVSKPNDIAIDGKAGVGFVVDTDTRVVRVFAETKQDRPSSYPTTIPTTGPDPNVLANPTGVAIDTAAKEVFVSDFGDSAQSIGARIQVFDYQGNLVATIPGKTGGGMFGKTMFSRPQGLAVDGGHVFVTASLVGRVMVYDRSTLTHVKDLGTYGNNPGELSLPLDVVVDAKSKDVWVTNNLNKRIEVFVKGGQIP